MNLALFLACAVCYGAADSGQTQGQNWAIFTMLGVTAFVLGSFGAMIVYFARRARRCQIAEEIITPIPNQILEGGQSHA